MNYGCNGGFKIHSILSTYMEKCKPNVRGRLFMMI